MLKVVLDTNIYLSALLFGGLPGKILKYGFERKFRLYLSADILTELQGILVKKFAYEEKEVKKINYLLLQNTVLIIPKKSVTIIKNWPADNRILECCLEAQADYLVSGDKKHLLSLKKFGETKILSCIEFWELLS